MNYGRRNKASAIFLGLVLIAIGIGVLGNSLHYWTFDIFFEGFWTLFLIIPGVMSMIREGIHVGNSVLTVIGVLLLLKQQGYLTDVFSFPVLVSIVLILIGISVVFRQFRPKKYNVKIDIDGSTVHNYNTSNRNADYNDFPVYTAIFWGVEAKNSSRNFKGADVTTVFGGADLDFSEAVVTEDITITATAVFGGIDMIVPRNARIIVHPVCIFGGCDNKAPSVTSDGVPTIHINTYCIFGGMDLL